MTGSLFWILVVYIRHDVTVQAKRFVLTLRSVKVQKNVLLLCAASRSSHATLTQRRRTPVRRPPHCGGVGVISVIENLIASNFGFMPPDLPSVVASALSSSLRTACWSCARDMGEPSARVE